MRRGRLELDGPALERLVRELAASPERWAHFVSHSREQRHYEELHRDDDTGFHDHDLSGGAVAVVAGAVAEDRLALGGSPVTREFVSGQAFHFSAADIHRVRHTGTEPAVTIHAYSPPLWRMGAYEVLPGGELRRHSLSYAEELRPLG